MGGLKSTSTSTQRVRQPGQNERALLDMLQAVANNAGGQMGDLSSLASGSQPTLSPEVAQLIEQVFAGQADTQTRAAKDNYADTGRKIAGSMRERGMAGSSVESVYNAIAGEDLNRTLADIESQRSSSVSQAKLDMPFKIASQQMSANQLLAQILMGVSNPVLGNLSGTRMANVDGTQTQDATAQVVQGLVSRPYS